MDSKHSLRIGLVLLCCVGIALGATACAGTVTPGPRAWIDVPVDGASVPLGTPVPVTSHAYAQEGVAEVLLSVNGEAYRRDPPAAPGTLGTVTQEWRPDREGDYVLQVTAYATSGAASSPATVRVRVTGKGPTPTPVPVTGAPDLVIVSVEPIVVGYKGAASDIPICDTRVVYRNAGTEAVPPGFTIQFYFNGVPQLTMLSTGTLAPGASGESTFVYRFEGSPYIGITLDSTNVVAESNETNNAFAEIRVCTGAPPPTTVAPPTVTPTSTSTRMPAKTPTPTSTSTRMPTKTPTPTATTKPVLPAQVNFRADKTSLTQGECTTLRWDVDNATAVYLDGQGVTGHASKQVCPKNTTTYNLHVEAPSGNVDRSVTINVTAPRDTTPPPVPSPQVPRDGLAIDCKSTQTLAWLPVSDPSGIAGYYVKLERQVTTNNWQSVRGWGPVTDKQVTANVDCGGIYRWAVRAQDGAGNYSDWSAWSHFSIKLP